MTWLTLMVLVATPTNERIVVLPWTPTGVAPGVADFAASRFAELLQERGRTVTTAEQMTAVIGFERQKQLLQCGNESRSCLVELSNAMGARLLALGRVTKLGSKIELDVRVLDATNGERVAGARQTAESEDALSDALANLGAAIAAQLSGEPMPELVRADPSPRTSKLWPAVTLSAGVTTFIAGTVCLIWGQLQLNRLTSDERLGVLEARNIASSGQTVRGVGIGLGLAGLAAGVVGAVWLANAGSDAPPVALFIGPGSVSVAARF